MRKYATGIILWRGLAALGRYAALALFAAFYAHPAAAIEPLGFDTSRFVIPSAKGADLRFTTDGFGNYLTAFGAEPAFVSDDHGGFIRFFPLWDGEAERGIVWFEVARECHGRRYQTRFQLPYSEVTFAPIDFQLHINAIARQGTPCGGEVDQWVESDPLVDAIARNADRFNNSLYRSIAALSIFAKPR